MHHFTNSSTIKSCEHKDGCLHITFQSGKTYKYKDCEEHHLDGLKASKSPGSYFSTYIRAKYKHEIVE